MRGELAAFRLSGLQTQKPRLGSRGFRLSKSIWLRGLDTTFTEHLFG